MDTTEDLRRAFLFQQEQVRSACERRDRDCDDLSEPVILPLPLTPAGRKRLAKQAAALTNARLRDLATRYHPRPEWYDQEWEDSPCQPTLPRP